MLKILTVLSLITLILSGCNNDQAQSNKSLVVDLAAVARAVGRDEEMTGKLEQARQVLSEQLEQIGNDLKVQLIEKEMELEKAPKSKKEESKLELEQMTQQANVQLNKTRQLANQKAVVFRDNLINEFRVEVMTIAEEIAQQRKASMVYATGSGILWHNSDIDITDEVIGKLRATRKTVGDEPLSKDNVDESVTATE